jgi:dephospho-CoA kinase
MKECIRTRLDATGLTASTAIRNRRASSYVLNFIMLKKVKALIFGPSGSGKTYVSHSLSNSGINAFDGDDIKGLSEWYDKQGKKVAAPITANDAIANHYSFLWSRKFLANFLCQFKDVYLFGGCGNLFDMIDLFDKVFFLNVPAHIQIERLQGSRKDSMMDFNKNELVIWGDWLEQEAKKRNVPFIDATLSPKDIFSIVTRD